MPTQSDFDKVQKCIITPMLEYYECKINNPQRDAFVEDLCRFSEATLNAAWKHVRRECKFPPKLAHFMDFCKEVPVAENYRAVGDDKRGKWSHWATDSAKAIMRSPIGQKALREGVGYDLWVAAERDGRTDFTDADIEKFKAATAESIRLLNAYPDKRGKDYARLESWFNGMEARAQKLELEYLAA